MSARMAAQIQQVAAATALGQGQPSVTAVAPPILQSSSVPGNAAARAQPKPKNAAPTNLPRKASTDSAQSVLRTPYPPGVVTKATHQLPGRIIKMTSGLPPLPPSATAVSGAAATLVRRGSQSSTPDPAPMDTSTSSSNSSPGAETVTSPRGALRQTSSATSARRDSKNGSSSSSSSSSDALLLPVDFARVPTTARKASSNVAEERRVGSARSSSMTSARKDSNLDVQGQGQGQGGRAAQARAAAQAAVNQEALDRALLMQNLVMKAMAEKHNGGVGVSSVHPGGVGVNVPALPGVLPPLSLTTLAAVSGGMGGLRYAPVPAVARATPLPSPPSSVVTSPALSGLGLTTSLATTATPSAAHAQPTRPLLLFRSTSVDPGSGDGRRMGSVELHHVTPADLLALQRSATNSVNPANSQTLKSGPLTFQQQMQIVSARGAGGGGGGGFMGSSGIIPMETDRRGPPLSNHVSQASLHGYGLDGDSDEPKDLSLKPRRTEVRPEANFFGAAQQFDRGTAPVPTAAAPPAAHSAGRKANGSSRADASAGKKRKAGGNGPAQRGRPRPASAAAAAAAPRKAQRAKGANKFPPSTGVEATSGTDRHLLGPGIFMEGRGAMEVRKEEGGGGGKEKPDLGEGRTGALLHQSGLVVRREADSDVKPLIVEVARDLSGSRQGERRSPTLKPGKKPVNMLLPVEVPPGKPVAVPRGKPGPAIQQLQTNPALNAAPPGRAAPGQGKTTPPTVKDKSRVAAAQSHQGSARLCAKDKSDQNDNVHEASPPRPPVSETGASDADRCQLSLALKEEEVMEVE